jgi:hypothetical protein
MVGDEMGAFNDQCRDLLVRHTLALLSHSSFDGRMLMVLTIGALSLAELLKVRERNVSV